MTTRTPLRRELADLKQRVYIFGEKCIEASDLYNSLLEVFSNTLESRLIAISNEVKKESKELNNQCFLVLTLQQPLIRDLRFVIGSLQIILNIEKITEHYVSTLPNISEINILENNIKEQFINMAKKVQKLLRITLTLYLSSNLSSSDEITNSFSEVNYHHDLLYKHILKGVAQASGEKAQIEAQLLTTVRTLEKIADLIISNHEQVKYMIVGKSDSN